jgi:threonyl-tRNA synthetase
MAEAVLSMFPDARFGIGPPIENGFYYDFELPRSLTMDDLGVIEERMRQSIAADQPFEHSAAPKDEARRIFAGQPYKLELIDGIEDEAVSLYRQGPFLDLCEGPHVESTGQVKAFKLTGVAGAYWRGDERNPMLQRIYGALFETQEELEAHLHVWRRCDHCAWDGAGPVQPPREFGPIRLLASQGRPRPHHHRGPMAAGALRRRI